MPDVSVVQWLREEVEKLTIWLPPEADTRAMWEALDAVENTLLCSQGKAVDGDGIEMPL